MESTIDNNSSALLIYPNYLSHYQAIYLPYLVLNFVGIIFGTLGNLIILFTIALDKNLRRNPAYMLMFNLSLSDISISIFVDGFTNIGILFSGKFFEDRMGLCVFLGSFCLIACGTSLFNMGFLAINRYINICRHHQYRVVFTKRNTYVCCALAWIAGILVDLPNFLGWGGHFFDKKSANCMWNRLASHSYSIFFPTTAIFIPCLLIFFCYLRIFLFVKCAQKQSSLIVLNRTSSEQNPQSEMTSSIQSFRVAISLFASFSLFAICWIPYGVMITADFADSMPMSLHAAFTFLAHFNSAMNPVLYILLNPAFKKSIKNHFYKRKMSASTHVRTYIARTGTT